MVNPAHQGLAARYGWMAVAEREHGNDPLQAIEKVDLLSGERRVWSASPRGFVNEPVMVPHPQLAGAAGATVPSATVAGASAAGQPEDLGWVLVLVWNGARCASDLVILDAATMAEQAVVELPLALPYGLHGTWSPA
jgi:all-trans-8'-apo-beta-carotenal 15,15'-oxygenase